MANLQLIKQLLRDKNISIRDFAKELDITEQALQLLIRKNSTKIETLELIAQKLNVSISVFFEGTDSDEKPEKERLLSIIESQQRTIEVLANKSSK